MLKVLDDLGSEFLSIGPIGLSISMFRECSSMEYKSYVSVIV